MKVSSLKATAFLSAAVFAASVGTADAAAVDAVNAKCRATMAKNTTKYAAALMKAHDGCIKNAVKALGGNCTTNAAADSGGKAAAAAGKIGTGAAASCLLPDSMVALDEHDICGTPVGTAVTDFATLSSCMTNLNAQNIERLRNAILKPTFSLAAGDVGKCINAIAKNATKLFSTIQKEQSKAANASDKAGGDSNYTNPGDPGGKISAARGKFADGVTKACSVLTPAQWGAVGTCDDTVSDAIDCIDDKVTALAEGLTASCYDQPGSCPAAVQVKIHHGASEGLDLGPTELDVGWTGFGHDSDIIDDFVGRVNIACGAAPDDCTTCNATLSCAEGNCRCSNAIQTKCAVPFAAGGVCGAGTCEPYFGPPLPLSASGTPTCVLNKITSELVNTANIATGESDTQIDNRAIVFTGIAQDQPCPTCEAGVCNGGQRNGQPCTVDGTSETFGDTSYDCPPTTLSNISGAGLKISLDLTDDAVSLPFALPCDPPLGALDCACSTCTGDNSLGCNSDADCAAAGAGTCRTDGLHGGQGRIPNGCSDGTCEVLSGEEGQCSGQFDSFCDGFVKANGGGILTCSVDADCGTYGVPGAGNCALSQTRKCFLNPIEADGTPGSEGAVLVSTFCSAPTASGAVNAAAGTPGPSRLALDFEFYGKCADGVTPWGPGGASCQ